MKKYSEKELLENANIIHSSILFFNNIIVHYINKKFHYYKKCKDNIWTEYNTEIEKTS